MPELEQHTDENGLVIEDNTDLIESRTLAKDKWNKYGPHARAALAEVCKLKDEMAAHLAKFDIKIVDFTYAAHIHRARSYKNKPRHDPFGGKDGAMKIAFKVRDEDIDK